MMQRFPRIKAGGDNSATPFFAPPVLAFHTTGTAAFGYCEKRFQNELLFAAIGSFAIDYQNNRAAQFDSIEEGGIRASSYLLMKLLSMTKINILMGCKIEFDFYYDHLGVKLTGEVHEEVEIHNHALDLMGHDIDTSSGVLSGTVDRSKMVFERKLNRRMITLVISFLVFYSYIT
ncbi:SNARE domain [Musa troglodytarum]|uniref:SNARE domain n=1 Tax=Musa troglodytarum TaxID=320322 RepID=A0A9E7K4J1_9LILI|nr:SNARE domain [Musa troglodytarum]